MGAKPKPVQPTVIKDKAIVEQVIREIRRQPTAAQVRKMREEDQIILSMIREGEKRATKRAKHA
jgi:hypothetical protein